MEVTLAELSAALGGTVLSGSAEVRLTGINSLAEARAGDLSFFANEKYLPALRTTRASAVLVPRGFAETLTHTALVAVDNPSLAFSDVMVRHGVPPKPFVAGMHPTAIVHPTASLDPAKVSLGPYVVIDENVVIGDGTELGAGVYVGDGTRLGAGCRIFPHVTILRRCVIGNRVIIHSGTVIGSDGFGYEFADGRHQKIPQVGIVQIDDDVEIGSNTSIDRARFGRTWIGEGTKIDNLVQIAHNVVIGKHCIIAGLAGIAGSTRFGDGVVIAAQAGVAGHLELATGVIVTAQSGVSKNLNRPGPYMGLHALPLREMMRILAAQRRLPDLLERVRRLEQRLGRQDQDGA